MSGHGRAKPGHDDETQIAKNSELGRNGRRRVQPNSRAYARSSPPTPKPTRARIDLLQRSVSVLREAAIHRNFGLRRRLIHSPNHEKIAAAFRRVTFPGCQPRKADVTA